MTRKLPSWSVSLGLHFLAAALLGMFWIVSAEEIPDGGCGLGGPRELPVLPRLQREADVHPPIEPPKFVKDPAIINDAERVVVNSFPTNVDSERDQGDRASGDAAFSLPAVADRIGAAAGGGGRVGFRGQFG